MHNSAAPLLKASAVTEPSHWAFTLSPWVSHSLRWILFYTGWLSVIHLSMQHTWSTAGGLGIAAAWWALLHWHPLRAWQSRPVAIALIGSAALIGLMITHQAGNPMLAIIGLLVYVLGLSYMVTALDARTRPAMMLSPGWVMVLTQGLAISIALLLAANHLLWAQHWPWFATLLVGAVLLIALSSVPTQNQPPAHTCQPDPTMALMMAFLPMFSLWCATPWISATQHLGLHLISMAAGQVLMLMLLKRFTPAVQHPLWGHALCIAATGLIWATTDTTLMLAAMVLLSAGSLWTQMQRPLRPWAKSIALLLGMLSISVTAYWAHTMGPQALGYGLFLTSLIWTLLHMGLHFRSSYEQRRH